MRAHRQKQQEQQKLREVLNNTGKEAYHEKTLEEKIERVKYLQYEEHQQLFAVAYTNIHKAAADNSLAGIKYFLHQGMGGAATSKNDKSKKKKVTILEELNKNGMSPLHCAAEKGAVDVLTFLLEAGCDVNLPSFEGNTAIMYACKGNQLRAIEAILADPATDLLLSNSCGMNCFHFAAQIDNHESIERLIVKWLEVHAGPGVNPVLWMADASTAHSHDNANHDEEDHNFHAGIIDNSDNHSIGSLTLHKETMVLKAMNQPSNNKTTPLHLASANGSISSVEVLTKYSAQVDPQDSFGDTPLHKAAKRSYFHVYRHLMKHGASDSIQNSFRETPADCLVDKRGF